MVPVPKTNSTYSLLSMKSISERTLIKALKTKNRIVQVLFKAVMIALIVKLKRAHSNFSQSRKMLQALVWPLAPQIATAKML
jgi:hypothetical protein